MSARILTCVYCGHEYPQNTPAWGNNVLTDHISQCEAHPMRRVVQERDMLRAALVGLVGAAEVAELRKMEAAITLLPAPDEHKAVTINALHALIATA